jgi:hypothetical protein
MPAKAKARSLPKDKNSLLHPADDRINPPFSALFSLAENQIICRLSVLTRVCRCGAVEEMQDAKGCV